MRGVRGAAALAAVLWLPAAAAALFDDDEARRRIEVLRQQVEANARTLEERLARQEAEAATSNTQSAATR